MTSADIVRGFGAAIADLIRDYDQPTMAVQIARSNGLSLTHFEIAGCDKFDLEPIRKAFLDNPERVKPDGE
jgi:hypothetical protein